jgi:MYXO-CTERM domain-containing protein
MDGAVRALRLSVDGSVLDAEPLDLLEPSDVLPAPEVLAVEPAGASYLILVRRNGVVDGGAMLVGARVGTSGDLLDPGGFDLVPSSSATLAPVSPDLWLLSTLEPVADAFHVRGRYVGATSVPAVPTNVEPPWPRDAGALGSSGTPPHVDASLVDSATVLDASTDGGGTGSSHDGATPSMDTADGSPMASAATSPACDCALASGGDGAFPGWWLGVALAGGLRRLRRRRAPAAIRSGERRCSDAA